VSVFCSFAPAYAKLGAFTVCCIESMHALTCPYIWQRRRWRGAARLCLLGLRCVTSCHTVQQHVLEMEQVASAIHSHPAEAVAAVDIL
jgi:hypothetical protein